MVSVQEALLPPLRQELELSAAPAGNDGAPAWTLYDPATHRFFQLGWPAFEILSRWSLRNPAAIAAAVQRDTTLLVGTDDVLALLQFLGAQQLLAVESRSDTQRLLQAAGRHRLSPAMWLLKHYLFIRLPLLHPMALLKRLSPWMQWVYSAAFWKLTAGAALLGLLLASRHWDEFLHTFRAYADWRGMIGIMLALSFAKVLHEFGHALTAYRYGCRVSTMGVALLVLWPVLYTDTNDAWKLRSRRQRLHIGAAGMLAEFALAAYATLLWNFLPDSPLRAGVFMLATSTWVMTLTINASPFTRFDGYFLLSDWLNVPNLHERAFALTRWWLRHLLLGLDDPPPEVFPDNRRRFLIAFSVAAWLYRLVLFFSIALLVFHAFFRALGLALMMVEIGWFIVLPVVRELAVWWQRRDELRWCRQSVRTAATAAAMLLVLCVPLRNSVTAPAVLMRERAQGVYAPRPAQVVSVAVRDGQQVKAGEVLALLTSPELDYQLHSAEAEEATLRWQVEQQPFDDQLRDLGPGLRKHQESVAQAAAGFRAQIAQLTLRAPFDGELVDIDAQLRAGVWLKAGERLFDVIGNGGVRGEAYVGESDLARIHDGASVRFTGDLFELTPNRCRVSGVDRINQATLDQLYVASLYGGAIPSQRDRDNRVVPLASTFRVRFDHCESDAGLSRENRGRAQLRSDAESLAARGMRWLFAVIRSEAML